MRLLRLPQRRHRKRHSGWGLGAATSGAWRLPCPPTERRCSGWSRRGRRDRVVPPKRAAVPRHMRSARARRGRRAPEERVAGKRDGARHHREASRRGDRRRGCRVPSGAGGTRRVASAGESRACRGLRRWRLRRRGGAEGVGDDSGGIRLRRGRLRVRAQPLLLGASASGRRRAHCWRVHNLQRHGRAVSVRVQTRCVPRTCERISDGQILLRTRRAGRGFRRRWVVCAPGSGCENGVKFGRLGLNSAQASRDAERCAAVSNHIRRCSRAIGWRACGAGQLCWPRSLFAFSTCPFRSRLRWFRGRRPLRDKIHEWCEGGGRDITRVHVEKTVNSHLLRFQGFLALELFKLSSDTDTGMKWRVRRNNEALIGTSSANVHFLSLSVSRCRNMLL